MTTMSKIESEIAALPPNLRAEVLDFVQFLKQRHGLPAAPAAVPAAPAEDIMLLREIRDALKK